MHKIEVINANGVYVVSDGGLIAKTLGLGSEEWHMVAPTANHIPDRIERMEALLGRLPAGKGSDTAGMRDAFAQPTNGAAAPKAKTPRAKKKAKAKPATKAKPIPGGAAVGSLSIRDLVGKKLMGTHVARLEKVGIKTVSQLCGKTADDLRGVKGVGPKMVKVLEASLKSRKLRLAAVV